MAINSGVVRLRVNDCGGNHCHRYRCPFSRHYQPYRHYLSVCYEMCSPRITSAVRRCCSMFVLNAHYFLFLLLLMGEPTLLNLYLGYCGKTGADTIPACFMTECPDVWQAIQGSFDCASMTGEGTSVTGTGVPSAAPTMPTEPSTSVTTGHTIAPRPNTMSSEYSSGTESPSSGFEPPSSAGSSRHLTSGAIAGIAIGAVLGIVIALVLLLYIIRRHRMERDASTKELSVSALPELQGSATAKLPVPGASPSEELWAIEPAAVELQSSPWKSSGISPDPTLGFSGRVA